MPLAEHPPGWRIDYGGVCLSLESASSAWLALTRQRYQSSAHVEQIPPTLALNYEVTSDVPLDPAALFAARAAAVSMERRAETLHIRGQGFSGIVDLPRCSAQLSGPLATYPVDLLMRSLWYHLVPDGLIVHAAALHNDRGGGWLLSGPSGAGKSTMAALFPQHAMCEELAAVRLTADGPLLMSLPFWRYSPLTVPLHGIFALRHERRNVTTRLAATEAAARLRPEIVWPDLDDAKPLLDAVQRLAALIQKVPIWDLGFTPNRRVWRSLASVPIAPPEATTTTRAQTAARANVTVPRG